MVFVLQFLVLVLVTKVYVNITVNRMDLISITGNDRLQVRSDARFLCDELFVCVAVLVFFVLSLFMYLNYVNS